MSSKILLVEDNENVRKAIQILLSKEHRVVAVSDMNSAIAEITHQQFDAVIVDLKLPAALGEAENLKNGFAVIQAARKHLPNAWITVITAYGDVTNVQQTMRQLGADAFLDKPINNEDLLVRLDEGLQDKSRQRKQIRAEFEHWPTSPPPDFMGIVGETPAIQKVCEDIQMYAISTENFGMVWGESGTGKELVSRAIHHCNPHSKRCLTYNCATIPKDFPESELFGIADRIATGVDYREGFFQYADGGTLILDEAHTLPENIQAQLLRVVQFKVVKKVGKQDDEKVDVRTILVTNRNLNQSAKDGTFREDLLNRLKFEIYIPPLRERKEDIPHLVNHFIRQYVKRLGNNPDNPQKFQLRSISQTVWKLLYNYDWPGNLHELSSVIDNALIRLRGSILSPGDILPFIKSPPLPPPTTNPLESWYRWIREQANRGKQIDYDYFKRYAVMRAIDEIITPSQELKWTDVGEIVGLQDKRVYDLLGSIASDFGYDPANLRQSIKEGKAGNFVKDAIKYYEEQLSSA